MFRLIVLLLAVLLTGAAGPPGQSALLPEVPPLRPSAVYPPSGPATATGAVLWLHGGVSPGQFTGPDTPDGQPAPPWLGRLAAQGWDVWRYNRTPGHDPLDEGEAGTIRGLEALHAAGYRRVILAGFSRGAFIGMVVLARPDLIEAAILLSPAAHGTRPERRGQAIADFAARLAAARGPLRLALTQFNDDPFDPDPVERGTMAREAARRAGMRLLHIERPNLPAGHMGSYEPEFDTLFGDALARFATGEP